MPLRAADQFEYSYLLIPRHPNICEDYKTEGCATNAPEKTCEYHECNNLIVRGKVGEDSAGQGGSRQHNPPLSA